MVRCQPAPISVTWWLWMHEGPGCTWYSPFWPFWIMHSSQVNGGYPVSFIQHFIQQWTDPEWMFLSFCPPWQSQEAFQVKKKASVCQFQGRLFAYPHANYLSMLWCVNMLRLLRCLNVWTASLSVSLFRGAQESFCAQRVNSLPLRSRW